MACDPKCIYFDSNPKIEGEYEEDGVKHRKTKRICGYSGKPIENWHRCFRKNGPKYRGE